MTVSVVKLQAEEAASVACWALMEERRTPWWRLFRRRWLQCIFAENAALHERLTTEAALQQADSGEGE
jgi:hypothetical protein